MTKIDTPEALEALYGKAVINALKKETPELTPEYHRWIERSCFFAIASVGDTGIDCSPRGDTPQQLFKILDNKRLAIPDRRGNNRLDTLKNIVADPRVSLLFFIPGIEETLRIKGRATVTTDPALIDTFEVDGKKPLTVIFVDIDTVFFQCARALKRAHFWDVETQADKSTVPTAGQMVRGAISDFDGDAYDSDLESRQKATLY